MRSISHSNRRHWNRRELLQGAASLTALHALPGLAATPRPRYAYIGSTEGHGSIHVFAVHDARWTPIQTIPSRSPASLVLAPTGRHLYAANEIDTHDGLPRGSVESFAVDPHTGRLTRQSCQPLSLSGTLPRHLALSPDGRHLAVAVYGGGACNMLPIADSGSLGPVSAILKQTGAGPHPEHQRSAHPHTVVFDSSGNTLLLSDLGTDHLSLFTVADGQPTLVGRVALPPGSGPGQMSLHPDDGLLFVANHLQPSVSTLAFPSLTPLHTAQLGGGDSGCSLLLHPSGRLLYTTSGSTLIAWSINPRTGSLTAIDRLTIPNARIQLSQSAYARDAIHLLDQADGYILRLPLHPETGKLDRPLRVATAPRPRSLVLAEA